MPEAFLVSYGSSPYEKRDGHGALWHLVHAVADCLRRAGLAPQDVDGLALASFTYPPGNVVTLAEELSMRLRWCEEGATGGAAGVQLVGHAADQIRNGRIRCALVVCGDAFAAGDHVRLLEGFAPVMRDHLGPHGFGGANGVLALLQTRHAHLYGTTRAQLGRIAVAQRAHALLNPRALFREPLTLEQYLEARPIAEPFHLYDCVMPCSGAEAVLVASAELVGPLGRPPVLIRAMREVHNAFPDQISELSAGWRTVGDELWAETGLHPGDLDLVELYDDYPIAVALQLEGYGFCGQGESGPFLERTDISFAGELPLNTGGGQLSVGQAGMGGGLIHVTEAVQQLQHEGGARQVAGARLALVSGFGYISYARGLCTAAAILERRGS